jgi:hypothetical protein
MKCAVVSSETKTEQGTTTRKGHCTVKKYNCTFSVQNEGWGALWKGGHYKRGSRACIYVNTLAEPKE